MGSSASLPSLERDDDSNKTTDGLRTEEEEASPPACCYRVGDEIQDILGNPIARVERLLGEGAFGSVMLTTLSLNGFTAAVKTVKASVEMSGAERHRHSVDLLRETKTHFLAGIHVNIVCLRMVCLDHHPDRKGTFCIFMDLAAGSDLHRLGSTEGSSEFNGRGPLYTSSEGTPRPRDAVAGDLLSMILQLARALEHTSSKGVLHQDVKPEVRVV